MTFSETFAKILRWGIFISLFLPLIIFSQYLSPFHFGKVILFRIIVEAMLIFYVPLFFSDKKYRPKWTMILISFSVFTALYVFTGIIGVNSYNSFWGSLERMGGAFSFVHYWVYFIILISIIKTKKDWDKVLKICVFVGFLSILFAYGQAFIRTKFFVGWQHGERVIGTIGNPALFAGYLLFILYLSIFYLLKKDIPSWQKGLFAAVIILGVPILFMTAVRGAVVSFFGSIFLLGLFLALTSKNKKTKIILFVGIAIILFFSGIVLLERNSNWVKNNDWLSRLSDISVNSSTIQTRLWSWTSAIKGWKERPIFGWGPENFMYLHMKHFDPRHFTSLGSETIWDRAHNVILEMLSTMGIIGLLSYLFIFVSIFILLIKKFKEKKISSFDFGVITAMLIAYFGQNLFIFDTFANYFLFFLLMGYIYYFESDEPEIEKEKISTQEPSMVLTVILLVVAVFLIFQFNIKPAKANYACTRAIIAGTNGDANQAFLYYKKALDYNSPEGIYDIRHKLAMFTIQLIESQRQKQQNIDVNLLHYAIDKVKENIRDYPLDTSPYLYVGRMYTLLISAEPDTAGKFALEYINKALEINRKNPRIWYELGQAQLFLKQYEDSYNSFKEALNLNPTVDISYWFLGIVTAETGRYNPSRYQEAINYIDKAVALGYNYTQSVSDMMKLVNIYEKLGNYQKVIELYKAAISEQPNNPQLHASLAATYAKVGDYASAKEEALKAAEIDPNFKDEAEKFIKLLPIK